MRPCVLISLTLSCGLLVAAGAKPALAQDPEEPAVLEVEPVKERLACPKEQPTLRIKAPKSGQMRLVVRAQGSEDAPEQRFEAKLTAGEPLQRSWPQAGGEASYLAHLEIDYADGTSFAGDMGFSFVCSAPIDVRLAGGGLDLSRGHLKLQISGPAARAELAVKDESGASLHESQRKLNPAKAQQVLDLRWKADEARGFGGLDLNVFDRHGAWVRLDLTPVSLEIPHEEVEFENGKWDLRPSEEPKLQDTLNTIREEMQRFVGDLMEPSLYIIGYTDTVGSKSDNLALSAKRARSIAQWFRRNGLKHVILYQGYGEQGLAVETPDETPEPANRRAVYILTNFPPPVQPGMPKAAWKRVP